MADGYVKTEPDPSWWMDQIHAGIEFRKKMANEAAWDRWRSYYRGRWKGGILPRNVFFSMLRATVPRVYFRNPAVSVTPAIPGFMNMAFAQVLNRLDNKVISRMGMKQEMKDMVQDTFLKGTAVLKSGIGSEFAVSVQGFENEAPVGARREALEYHKNIESNMPWSLRICPGTFVVPVNCRRLREARWCAHWIRRPVDDVKRDPRFKNTRSLKGSMYKREGYSVQSRIEEVDLVEIRDFKYKNVIVLAPASDRDAQKLYSGPDELQARRFPFFELVFNLDDEVFWGVPDAQILEPYQLEINEIRTQAMKHRRLALIKWLMKKGIMEPEDIARLFSEDVAAIVEVAGNISTDISKIQVANIPADLIVASNEVLTDVRETLGFSRNELGEFQTRRGDTSAEEARNVREASEIRMDERRDAVADLIVAYVEEMHEIIFDHWTAEQVVEVVGPGGMPVWVQVNPSQLRYGRYTVKVDPDSSIPKTRGQREAKAAALYQMLKENPLIDPIKLTHYFLREMEGVELDDLLRAMPPLPGGGPGGPIPMERFGGMLQQGAQQLAANPPRALLAAGGGT